MKIIESHIFTTEEYCKIPILRDTIHGVGFKKRPKKINGKKLFSLITVHVGQKSIRVVRPTCVNVSDTTYFSIVHDIEGSDKIDLLRQINQFYYKN